MEKTCRRCGEVKPLDGFHRHSQMADGYLNICRACRSAQDAEYRSKNKERLQAKSAEYRGRTREQTRVANAKYRAENIDRIKKQQAEYYARNSERLKAYQVEYKTRPGKAEYVREREAKFRAANKEELRQWHRDYRKREPELLRQRGRDHYARCDKAARRERDAAYYRENRAQALQRNMAWAKAHPLRIKIYFAARRARKLATTTVPFTEEQLKAKFAYWNDCCWVCGDPATTVDHVKPLMAGGVHVLANLRPACRPCNSRKNDVWPLQNRAQIMGICD